MSEEISLAIEKRRLIWIRCSELLLCESDPHIGLGVENLAITERMLLQMEANLKAEIRKHKRDALLMECSAHSILWTLGLYETLRNMRNAKMRQSRVLEPLFRKVSVIRMPLAKHEVKGASNYRNGIHYPTSVWSPENGWVGWYVFDPPTRANQVYFRTDLANEFLLKVAGITTER